jgi:hypothetical protein
MKSDSTRKIFWGGGGVQEIQLKAERTDIWGGSPLNLQMNETHIVIRLLWMYYFPWHGEFSLGFSKLQNFGRGGV